MNTYAQIAEKIIKEQETIIGPVALEQAQKVRGLKINWPNHEITFQGNEKDIIEKLIEQYKNIFGQTSVEVCKEAVKDLIKKIPANQIPPLLRA